MSKRGLRLFKAYTANRLNRPDTAAMRAEDHAEALIAEANSAGIPIQEITEEVGSIADAFSVVKRQRERHAKRT